MSKTFATGFVVKYRLSGGVYLGSRGRSSNSASSISSKRDDAEFWVCDSDLLRYAAFVRTPSLTRLRRWEGDSVRSSRSAIRRTR